MFWRPPEVWSLKSDNALISGTGKVGMTQKKTYCLRDGYQVTAMAAGGEQMRSAHACDISLAAGARVLFIAPGTKSDFFLFKRQFKLISLVSTILLTGGLITKVRRKLNKKPNLHCIHQNSPIFGVELLNNPKFQYVPAANMENQIVLTALVYLYVNKLRKLSGISHLSSTKQKIIKIKLRGPLSCSLPAAPHRCRVAATKVPNSSARAI